MIASTQTVERKDLMVTQLIDGTRDEGRREITRVYSCLVLGELCL